MVNTAALEVELHRDVSKVLILPLRIAKLGTNYADGMDPKLDVGPVFYLVVDGCRAIAFVGNDDKEEPRF